jgi:hypothetical protein
MPRFKVRFTTPHTHTVNITAEDAQAAKQKVEQAELLVGDPVKLNIEGQWLVCAYTGSLKFEDCGGIVAEPFYLRVTKVELAEGE